MVLKKSKVSILVDGDFFRNMFEPSRKKIEEELGTRVSQPQFTRMLFKTKIDLNPKLNFDLKNDIKLKNLMPKPPRIRKLKNKRKI